MKNSSSLPSLFNESKLFNSQQQLQIAKSEFKFRFHPDNNKNQSQQRKPSRSLIHFQQNLQGFASFRSINTNKVNQILQSLKSMKSSSTNLGSTVKAQILFNKNQYAKITDYCDRKRKSQRQLAIIRLAKLQPLPMKKQVKKIEKNRKKIKTTVGINISLNYTVYQNNRICWKPYIDFDSMTVPIGSRVYFIGGRQNLPLISYQRSSDKWIQEDAIQNLKPFGQSQATILTDEQVVFFGGSKFFLMGQSETTNTLTYVNIKTKTAQIQHFQVQKVPRRCFHAQCKYGDFLIISGGINQKNKLYNNFVAFHLIKKYWFQLTIDKVQEQLKSGFAKHKMMSIFHPRKNYNIYEDDPIIASEEERSQISVQGLYIFGGEDSNVELSNKLYILKVGMPSIEVYEPKTRGTPPTPRKNFGWVRIRQYLFIHGGRNDEMRPWVLSSLNVLNLKTMTWLWVKGEKPALRHSHSLIEYGDQIVVLGGKNVEGLCKQIYPVKYEEVFEYL